MPIHLFALLSNTIFLAQVVANPEGISDVQVGVEQDSESFSTEYDIVQRVVEPEKKNSKEAESDSAIPLDLLGCLVCGVPGIASFVIGFGSMFLTSYIAQSGTEVPILLAAIGPLLIGPGCCLVGPSATMGTTIGYLVQTLLEKDSVFPGALGVIPGVLSSLSGLGLMLGSAFYLMFASDRSNLAPQDFQTVQIIAYSLFAGGFILEIAAGPLVLGGTRLAESFAGNRE